MKADSINLAGILTPAVRYVIPLFQRDYVWSKKDWEALWEDIVEIRAARDKNHNHFMGALVFFAEQAVPNKTPTFEVIDGQQRLITLTILLCAIRDMAYEHGFSHLADEINTKYLVDQFKKQEEHFRVYPRWRDRDQYTAAIGHKIVPGETIRTALDYFSAQIKYFLDDITEDNLRDLFNVISTRLEFVQINLSAGENAFQIFRSLNSTGVDLAESDLIRNYMFMKVGSAGQEDFDQNYWEPLEHHFELRDSKQKGKLDGKAFSAFLRDFLMHKGSYIGVNDTYVQFEQYSKATDDPRHLVEQLEDSVQLYEMIVGSKPCTLGDGHLDTALKQFRQLENSTPYPLVLNLLHRVKAGQLTANDATHAIRLLSGFILRRYVCNETSRTYGKWFVAACAQLKNSPLEDLRNFLIAKGFPDDARFQESFVTFNMYKGNYALAILKALEMSLPHKERADLSKANIEHIMPQTLNNEWTPTVGPQDGETHKKWLHTPGNLTITAYNSELGKKSFLAKRKIYQDSHFGLTKYLFQPHILIWNANEIEARAKKMAAMAKDIWIGPFA